VDLSWIPEVVQTVKQLPPLLGMQEEMPTTQEACLDYLHDLVHAVVRRLQDAPQMPSEAQTGTKRQGYGGG
jgi:hypothetical protein